MQSMGALVKRLTLLLSISLAMSTSVALAQFVPIGDRPNASRSTIPTNQPPTSAETVSTVDEEQPPEGGSQTVADFLKLLTPSVDTRLPESASQAATRISGLITAGRADKALAEIAKLNSDEHASLGTNVQLMFLEARAYTSKGDISKALEIYRRMTYRYPELAEPWNNMAVLQAQLGSLDEALSSLQMALSIRPDYAIANRNIGHIYNLLAQRSLQKGGQTKK